ncbi:MAG: DM13 domain-containing protein [bacterium]
MRRRWWWVIAAVVIVAGAPVAWYLGSPLFINRTVEEAFPASTGAEVPSGMTQAQVEERMMAASKESTTSEEAMPAAAVALRRGSFAGADSFHQGEGTATVYRVAGGLVLRLDPFRVTNGPDLHVILTKHGSPRSRDEVKAGYIEVAKLKGNVGSQNYSLPAGLRLEEYKAVVIYCKPFHVVFASAELAPGQ